MSQQQPERRIIIDEDWKSQVEAEKAAARDAAASASGAEKTSGADPSNQAFPEASIAHVVSMFATQALAAMGQIPDAEGKAFVQLDLARHFIDLIEVVQQKTKGNLSPDEAQLFEETLHELRMIYVHVTQVIARQAQEGQA